MNRDQSRTNLFVTLQLLFCLLLLSKAGCRWFHPENPPPQVAAYAELVDQLKATSPEQILLYNFLDLRQAFFNSPRVAEGAEPINRSLKQAFQAAVQTNSIQQIASLGTRILDQDYTSIYTHVLLSYAYGKLKRPEQEQYHKLVARGLADSITNSGDGKTPSTPWRVFQTAEEYDLLKLNFGIFTVNGRSTIDHHGCKIDVLHAKQKGKNKKEQLFYFDVTEIMNRQAGANSHNKETAGK